MFAVVLGAVALAAVTLSFGLMALMLLSHRPAAGDARDAPEAAATTLSRVISDVERLAVLRERGALTEKEFVTQKHKLLGAPAPARSRR